jgi:hypothetical protein
MSGPRDLDTGLWRINLKQDNQKIHQSVTNNVYELRNTGALVHYFHKALFSLTKSALLQAVKTGHLVTWPGLTEDAIQKHLKLTQATVMGHMNQRRQNIRSTLKTQIADVPTTDTNLGTKNHLVYAVLVDQGKLYTDLTENSQSDPAKAIHMSWSAMFMTATTLKSSRLNPGPSQNGSRPMITSIKNSLPRVSNQNSKLSTTRNQML